MAMSRIVELLAKFDGEGLAKAFDAGRFSKEDQRDQNILRDIAQLKLLIELYNEDIHHLRSQRIVGEAPENPEVAVQTLLMNPSVVEQLEQILLKPKLFENLGRQLQDSTIRMTFTEIEIAMNTVADAARKQEQLQAPEHSKERMSQAAQVLSQNESNVAARLDVKTNNHGHGLLDARRSLSEFVSEKVALAVCAPELKSYVRGMSANPANNIIDLFAQLPSDIASARADARKAEQKGSHDKAKERTSSANAMQKCLNAFNEVCETNANIAEAVALNNHLFELQKNLDKNAANYQDDLEKAIQACQQAEDFKPVKELEAAINADQVKEEDLEDALDQIARHCEDVLKDIETQARKEIDYNQYVLAKKNVRPAQQILNESASGKQFSPKVQQAIESYKAVSALHQACKKDSTGSTNAAPRSVAARFVATCRQVERTPANSLLDKFINKIKFILKWALASKTERAQLVANSHAEVRLEKTGIFKQTNVNVVKRPRSASLPNLSAINKKDNNAGKPRSSSAPSTPRSLSEPSSPVGSPDKEESILRRNLSGRRRRLG